MNIANNLRKLRVGQVPLLALQPRRVTDDEIALLANTFRKRRRATISTIDVGVAITSVTGEFPAAGEIERVHARLTVLCDFEEPYG